MADRNTIIDEHMRCSRLITGYAAHTNGKALQDASHDVSIRAGNTALTYNDVLAHTAPNSDLPAYNTLKRCP